ncbi:MAG: GAF domain-containing protein [Anaerolineales bacterium]|nr:GAF domain-containing protein [Anaerolineales bacterium]
MNEAYGLRALQQENIHLKEENRELSEQLFQLRHAIRGLNLLNQNLEEITPKTDVHEMINGILLVALQAVGAEEGSLILLDEETQELVFVDAVGQYREQLVGTRMPAGQGIAGTVMAQHMPVLVEDVRQEPQWYGQVDELLGFETQSILGVPVIDKGRVLGAIELVNKRDGSIFDEEDQDILVLVARLAAMTLVRAEEMTA